MSHLINIKTCFQNLSYLEKALNQLNIVHIKTEISSSEFNPESANGNVVIPQSNGYDIQFTWNKNQYELVVDRSFWEQSYPVESFIDKIGQQYAVEAISRESQKSGFQPIKRKQDDDGSNTLTLERWNNT